MPLLKETVYVTPDDFKQRYNRDLRVLLEGSENESNGAESFIALVTDTLKNWVDRNTFRNIDWCRMNPYQLNNFKKAILAQVYYTWREGAKALGLDSGADDERGIVIKKNDLLDLQICEAAINYLADVGLFNLTMKNRPRFLRGYPGMEFWGSWPDGGGVTGN